MSDIDNITKITVPSEALIAEVSAWPDEVQVTVHATEGNLTVQQARDLAAAIIEAADRAGSLDWTDDAEPKLVERANV